MHPNGVKDVKLTTLSGNRFGPCPGAARRAKTTDGFRQPPTQAAQSAALIRSLKINQIVGNGGQGRN